MRRYCASLRKTSRTPTERPTGMTVRKLAIISSQKMHEAPTSSWPLMMRLLLPALVLVGMTGPALAWVYPEHRDIAVLAVETLDPRAQSGIRSLVGRCARRARSAAVRAGSRSAAGYEARVHRLGGTVSDRRRPFMLERADDGHGQQYRVDPQGRRDRGATQGRPVTDLDYTVGARPGTRRARSPISAASSRTKPRRLSESTRFAPPTSSCRAPTRSMHAGPGTTMPTSCLPAHRTDFTVEEYVRGDAEARGCDQRHGRLRAGIT